MSLVVVTNERTGGQHLGNPDRDKPQETYDRPEKLAGCIDAAKQLERLTMPTRPDFVPHPLSLSRLVNGAGDNLPRLQVVETNRAVPDEDLSRVHPAEYIRSFAAAQDRARAQQAAGQSAYEHTFGREAAVSPHTEVAARSAAGAGLDVVDRLLARTPRETAFAMVWPPGHHAEPELAMGFCYYSNVAIAAKYARDHVMQINPGRANRVAIIDIDHHRGNGTARALANEHDVAFFDLVYASSYDEVRGRYTDGKYDPLTDRYENGGKEYPYTQSDPSIGAVPHPLITAPNVHNIEFGFTTPEHIMDRYIRDVLPALKKFQPDIVLWSVGVDSAMGDVLGGMGQIPGSFFTMIRGTRLALPTARHGGILEGGYDAANWYRCVQPVLLAFHVDADDSKNHSRFFARYRKQFEDSSLSA